MMQRGLDADKCLCFTPNEHFRRKEIEKERRKEIAEIVEHFPKCLLSGKMKGSSPKSASCFQPMTAEQLEAYKASLAKPVETSDSQFDLREGTAPFEPRPSRSESLSLVEEVSFPNIF